MVSSSLPPPSYLPPRADRSDRADQCGVRAGHIGVTYLWKAERVRFVMILFPLGIVWGACIHLIGSVIASPLFHAGADLMVISGLIAAFHKEEKNLLEQTVQQTEPSFSHSPDRRSTSA